MIKMCNAKTHRYFTAFVIFAFIISCAYSFIAFHAQIVTLNQNKDLIEEDFDNISWHLVFSCIESIQRTQKIQSKLVATQLKNDIENAYPNLNELQSIFESGTHAGSTPFSKIVLNTVHNTKVYFEPSARNGVMIGFNDKVLHNLIVPTKQFETDWDTFVKGNYNKLLAENLIKEVTQDRKGIILLEPERPSRAHRSHFPRKITTMDDLRAVFEEEGLDGLSGYVIVTPTFITDDGDIFGTLDYNAEGIKTNNHKIIVMTYASLTDFIYNYQRRTLAYVEHMKTHNKNSRERDVRNIYYQSIQTIVIHFILIICIFVFSRYLFHGDICVGDDREGEDV